MQNRKVVKVVAFLLFFTCIFNVVIKANNIEETNSLFLEHNTRQLSSEKIEINYSGKRSAEGVLITWDSLNIVKSVTILKKENGKYNEIGKVDDKNEFLDKNVEDGSKYIYALEIAKANGEKERLKDLVISERVIIKDEITTDLVEKKEDEKIGKFKVKVDEPFFLDQNTINKYAGNFLFQYDKKKDNLEIYRYDETNLLMNDTGINNEYLDVSYYTNNNKSNEEGKAKNGQTISSFKKGISNFSINLDSNYNDYVIAYRLSSKDKGWSKWAKNGELIQLDNKDSYFNGIEIKIENAPSKYVVEYRTYSDSTGWQTWKRNGETSGEYNKDFKIQAIEVRVIDQEKRYKNDIAKKEITANIKSPGKYVIKNRDEAKAEIKEEINHTPQDRSDNIINNDISEFIPEDDSMYDFSGQYMPISYSCQLGDSGSKVFLLQKKLLGIGFDLGNEGLTGYYGEYTKAAVTALQKVCSPNTPSLWDGACGQEFIPLINYGSFTEEQVESLQKQEKIEQKSIILSPSDNEEAVRLLNNNLLKLGFDVEENSSYYGNYTRAALKAIQLQGGLSLEEANGNYGEWTQNRLNYLLDNILEYNEKIKIDMMKYYSQSKSLIEIDLNKSGILVEALQSKLEYLGFEIRPQDYNGYFGDSTKLALLAIQNVNEKSQLDGKYDNWTINELNSYTEEYKRTGTFKNKSQIFKEYKRLLGEITLKENSKGYSVELLQEKLEKLGFSMKPYGTTGIFGNLTSSAIKSIQKVKGIDITGVYNNETRKVILKLEEEFNDSGTFKDRDKMLKEYVGNETTQVTEISNGRYGKDVVYYSQWDSRWKNTSYNPAGNMGSAGCAPTSMAMVLSTLTGNEITPVQAAKFAMEEELVAPTGTKDSFFGKISEDYGLNYENYSKIQRNEVMNELSKGNKLGIAWMKAGHFTNIGHYVVLTGIEKIQGDYYFTVYDPYALNDSYEKVNYDGIKVVESSQLRTSVKAKVNIFDKECISYHIFDVDEGIEPLEPLNTIETQIVSKPVKECYINEKPVYGKDYITYKEENLCWILEEYSKYSLGEQVMFFTSKGEPYYATLKEGTTTKGEKAIVATADNIQLINDSKSKISINDFSFLINYTSNINSKEELIALFAGGSTIEDLNRLILSGEIITPEYYRQGIAEGYNNPNDLCQYIKASIILDEESENITQIIYLNTLEGFYKEEVEDLVNNEEITNEEAEEIILSKTYFDKELSLEILESSIKEIYFNLLFEKEIPEYGEYTYKGTIQNDEVILEFKDQRIINAYGTKGYELSDILNQ